MRPSGRAPDEMRAITIETGFTKHAEGSCLISFGDTRVLCTASIEDRTPPWLRGKGEGNTLGLMARGAIASALSQAIDSVIFVTLAFYGEFDITNLMIGQVIAKVVLSIVLVPFLIVGAVALAKRLDRSEG